MTPNRLLTDPPFSELGSTEKQQKWKWARTSENVAAVKAIEANYLQTVKMSKKKKMALLKKEELKRRKTQRTMKLLDTCGNHHGPVTQESILLVDTPIEKELTSEIGYLKATVAPDIRQMRRLKVDGKFKMMKCPCDELRQSIKNAIKPESNLSNDIDALLKQYI